MKHYLSPRLNLTITPNNFPCLSFLPGNRTTLRRHQYTLSVNKGSPWINTSLLPA